MQAGRKYFSCGWGWRTTNKADMDSIWQAVFHFPKELTFTA